MELRCCTQMEWEPSASLDFALLCIPEEYKADVRERAELSASIYKRAVHIADVRIAYVEAYLERCFAEE